MEIEMTRDNVAVSAPEHPKCETCGHLSSTQFGDRFCDLLNFFLKMHEPAKFYCQKHSTDGKYRAKQGAK